MSWPQIAQAGSSLLQTGLSLFGGGGGGGATGGPSGMQPPQPQQLDPGAAMGAPGMADPMSIGAMSSGPAGNPAAIQGAATAGGLDPSQSQTDPLMQAQLNFYNRMANPSMLQQTMGAMGPVGAQLLQARLAQMQRQAPTANLQGGANPVSGTFGTASPGASSTVPMSQQYMSILEALSR